MTTTYELAYGRERLRALIAFAIKEGWQVRRTSDGRILFSKPGSAAFYTGAALNDAAKPRDRGNHHG